MNAEIVAIKFRKKSALVTISTRKATFSVVMTISAAKRILQEL